MILSTTGETDIFSNFSKKQEQTILRLIENGDYTQIYQPYISGIIGRSTDIRNKGNLFIIAEGNKLSVCAISELSTRLNPTIIVRKTKPLSDFLTEKYSTSEEERFPCFSEFEEDVKKWLIENWKINSYKNTIEQDPITAFKSGNLNITPLRGRLLFEHFFNEENFDFENENLGFNNTSWFLKKYFFLSDDEKLDLKNYSLEQLQNGRFCYILYLIVFLDPGMWGDEFNNVIKESEKAKKILIEIIEIANKIRKRNIVFAGKLAEEVEENIFGVSRKD